MVTDDTNEDIVTFEEDGIISFSTLDEDKKSESNDEESNVDNETSTSGDDTQDKDAVRAEVYEEIATGMGWKPKDNFKGDTSKFVEAEQFVKNEREINAKTRETKDRLLGEIQTIKGAVKEIRQHDLNLIENMKTKHKQEINDLRSKLQEDKTEAIKDADVDEVSKIDDKLKKLDDDEAKLNAEPETVDAEPETDPVFDEWIEKNPWYNTDKRLKAVADSIAQENPNIPLQSMLKLVDAEMVRFMPEEKNEQQRTPLHEQKSAGANANVDAEVSAVGGASLDRSAHASNTHTFVDLDEAAQKACDRFIQMGAYKNRQEYVDEYYELNE